MAKILRFRARGNRKRPSAAGTTACELPPPGRVINTRPMSDDTKIKVIVLDTQPIRIDATWGFKFVHSDGAEDHVNGFPSEEFAAQWLSDGGLETWAGSKKYAVSQQKR
jgi:hypothetical protein